MVHPKQSRFKPWLIGITVFTISWVPVLVFMYVRLAGREEREVMARQGEEYLRCVAATPAFLPRVWPSRKSDEDI